MRKTTTFRRTLVALFVLVFALLLLLAGCAGAHESAGLDSGWYQPEPIDQPQYHGYVHSSRYLTMRDGVRLAVDLYLPAGLEQGQRLPTILTQTRYFRDWDLRWPLSMFYKPPKELVQIVESGYALVRADVRGTGASFGVWPYPWSPEEVADGAEIVDWIVGQPWSDGLVGSAGGSYEGTAAEMLLINRHPAVKAVAPMFALYDAYTDIAFPGGIQLSWFSEIWERGNVAMDSGRLGRAAWYAPLFTRGVKAVSGDERRALLKQALVEHAANGRVHQEASQLTFRDDVSPGGVNVDRFSPHSYLAQILESGAAIYNYSGWYDGAYSRSAIQRYLAMGQRPQDKLIIGPWDHGGDDHVRQFERTTDSRFDHMAELRRFFDYHLKGIDSGIYSEPPVHYYTMGEDKWKSAASWPPPGAQQVSFYLAQGGVLAVEPPAAPGRDQYRVDPAAGTGDRARYNSLAVAVAVAYPHRERADRRLLVYQSAPLSQDTEVTGHPLVELFLGSSTDDADVFVYLEDVDERGRVGLVTEGELRASMRRECAEPPAGSPFPCHGFERADALPLVPGEAARMNFDLLPVSYLFRRGHCIRVAVAGVDSDHFKPLPGEPPLLTLYSGGELASRISLPVMPRGDKQ